MRVIVNSKGLQPDVNAQGVNILSNVINAACFRHDRKLLSEAISHSLELFTVRPRWYLPLTDFGSLQMIWEQMGQSVMVRSFNIVNFSIVTRLVLASTNCPKHTRLGETGRTWAKLEISAKVGDLDYDCDYER